MNTRLYLRYGLVALMVLAVLYLASLLILELTETEPSAGVSALLGALIGGLVTGLTTAIKDLYNPEDSENGSPKTKAAHPPTLPAPPPLAPAV